MRILVLKKFKKEGTVNGYWYPGDNATLLKSYGNTLVKKKLVAEIPHGQPNGTWNIQGNRSNKMAELWKFKKVTIEEYKAYLLRVKNG